MKRNSSLDEKSCTPKENPKKLGRSRSICSFDLTPTSTTNECKKSPVENEENDIRLERLKKVQRKKFGTRSQTVNDCSSYLRRTNPDYRRAKRSSSVKERGSSPHVENPSKNEESVGAKAWNTTEKVLGVHTVLGTAGLTSTSLITVPSLGGGVVGGCAAAAMGVATAASLVTGVGVLAGLGVAGVKYAQSKNKKNGNSKEDLPVETSSSSSYSSSSSSFSSSSDSSGESE